MFQEVQHNIIVIRVNDLVCDYKIIVIILAGLLWVTCELLRQCGATVLYECLHMVRKDIHANMP